jgi:hypothetical protein
VYIGPAVGKPFSIAVNIGSTRPDGILARDKVLDDIQSLLERY